MTNSSDVWRQKKILSVQSHVVHGYVGNRAATFPLQYRGWDVDALNTVNYSNHPGYGKFKGTKTTSDEIKEIFKGLVEIGCDYDVILTGYIADATSLDTVSSICQDYVTSRKDGKGCIWVLDPVLGDNGKLYVSKEILPIYQKMLSTDAIDLVTPNQFEMELLVDHKIQTLADLKVAITKFHQLYKVKNVIVTSVYLSDEIFCCGSDGTGSDFFYYEVPIIDASFSGSGDLFSALLTDAFYRHCVNVDTKVPDGLAKALGETLTVIEKILKISFEVTKQEQKDSETLGGRVYVKDLKLIQSKDVLLDDEILYKVKYWQDQ